jgi:hypothetical protein
MEVNLRGGMMEQDKRYFNQKFIALIFIIFGCTALVNLDLMRDYVYSMTVLIAYGIFAGLEVFKMNKEGISMNKNPDNN